MGAGFAAAGGRNPRIATGADGTAAERVGFRTFAPPRDITPMQITRLRAKNQITLPANVVAAVGLKQGDLLRVSAEQDQVIITARELHDRGRTYTMSDLLGAASGLYDSVADIDAEIATGRGLGSCANWPGQEAIRPEAPSERDPSAAPSGRTPFRVSPASAGDAGPHREKPA